MKRLIVTLCLPLSLMFVGCDSEPESERALEEIADGKKGPRGNPAEKLCALVSCSDEQQTEVAGLFDQHRPKRPDGEHAKRERPDLSVANGALADAFASNTFSTAAIAAHRDAVKQAHKDMRGEHADNHGEMLVALHGLLTAEQRATLADMFAEKGPRFLHGKHHGKHGKHGKRGKHGKHGKHHGQSDEGADANNQERPEGGKSHHKMRKHAGFAIKRLCKTVECTDDQREQLKGLIHEQKSGGDWEQAKQAKQEVHKAFAEAFRGEGFSEADVAALHDEHMGMKQEHMQRMDEMQVQVHGLLTPEQRAAAAEKIREHGPRALMGGKHGKSGKRHGKHGKAAHGEDGPCEGHGAKGDDAPCEDNAK